MIAEIAQGYEGRPEYLSLFIDAASAAGADAVKFQLVYAEELSVPGYKYHDLFASLELSDDVWSSAASRAKDKDIELILDVFGARSLLLAETLGVKTIKIHSTDMANIDFLNQVAKSSAPNVLLSCGGCKRNEIERAKDIMSGKSVVLLFGFQGYPTPNESNQVVRIREFAQLSEDTVQIGYADHAPPDSDMRFLISAAAIGCGASIIEKHLTLSVEMKMEDHESALNPDEFSRFVTNMRMVAESMGSIDAVCSDDFMMHESEKTYRTNVRKHVVATREIEAGHVLLPEDLTLKRSTAENPIYDLKIAYGQRMAQSVQNDQPITLDLFDGGSDAT